MYELAKRRCAERTRAELIGYAPQRPLSFEDELQLQWMRARCSSCRACAATLRTLEAMLPPPVEKTAEVIPLRRSA